MNKLARTVCEKLSRKGIIFFGSAREILLGSENCPLVPELCTRFGRLIHPGQTDISRRRSWRATAMSP
jgi:hypothetical protein